MYMIKVSYIPSQVKRSFFPGCLDILCQMEQDTSQYHRQKFIWERLLDILIFILVIFTLLFVCVRAHVRHMYVQVTV